MGKLKQSIINLGVAINGETPSGHYVTEILKSVGEALTGKTISGKSLSEIINNIADNWQEPAGKIEITDTTEVNVSAYATAQVVDENLIAENIKKDVTILGVTGIYEAVIPTSENQEQTPE